MNLNQWVSLLILITKEQGIQISNEQQKFLLSEYPEVPTSEQSRTIGIVSDVVTQLFFEKVSKGETFGDITRIKERFGDTLESNYGISNGPFFNLAKTYWTFKIEVNDLRENDIAPVLAQILIDFEFLMASVFFPTPGPKKIPVNLRREKQRELLEEFAPDLDIDRFLNENPILKVEGSRAGCLGLLLLIMIPTGLFVFILACLI